MKALPKFSIFLLLSITVLTGCQTTNLRMNFEDPDFTLNQLHGKTVVVTPVQVVEDNIPQQNKLSIIKTAENYNTQNLDVDTQTLLAQNLAQGIDLFTTKVLSKDVITKNNNGTTVIIPMSKTGNEYNANIKNDFVIKPELKTGTDFLLVPIALQLDIVNNVNGHYKNIDLIDPGVQAKISYILFDVNKNKPVASGKLLGAVEKSGLIDNTLGRDAILLAINNAASELLLEFQK